MSDHFDPTEGDPNDACPHCGIERRFAGNPASCVPPPTPGCFNPAASEAEAVGAVLPEAAAEEPHTDAEGGSGPEDALEAAESVVLCECGHTREQHEDSPLSNPVCNACGCPAWNPAEELVQTAPIFEAELVISSCGVFVQRLPGGGRQLKVVPIRQTAQGPQLVLPAYVLEFVTPESWDTFRGAIENDGKPKPNIVTASHLPPAGPGMAPLDPKGVLRKG